MSSCPTQKNGEGGDETWPNIFQDHGSLSRGVNDMHGVLCDFVQGLTVKQKRSVFQHMSAAMHLPDRCSVTAPVNADGDRLPLGFISVYRLLKGTTR
jgi:hypothetical protein